MRLIDEKGSLFGKINIVDFLALVLVVAMLPAGYFGYKIAIRPKIVKEIPIPTHYLISRACPNCGKANTKEIPWREPVPAQWQGKCEHCGNTVWFIKKPPPPKVPIPISETKYQELYYKYLLKEKGWLK